MIVNKAFLLRQKMSFKIKNITEQGRIGEINLEIEGQNLSWEWEFGSGEYIAIISVPDLQKWNKIFKNVQIKRENYLSEIAREIISLKCKECTFKITDNEILLLKSTANRKK